MPETMKFSELSLDACTVVLLVGEDGRYADEQIHAEMWSKDAYRWCAQETELHAAIGRLIRRGGYAEHSQLFNVFFINIPVGEDGLPGRKALNFLTNATVSSPYKRLVVPGDSALVNDEQWQRYLSWAAKHYSVVQYV